MTEVDCLVGEYRRAPVPIAEPVTKVGGRPVVWDAIEVPLCTECGHPLDFIAQVRLDIVKPPTCNWDIVYVFMCRYRPGQGPICASFDPRSGANIVVFQKRSDVAHAQAVSGVPEFEVLLTHAPEPDIDSDDASIAEAIRDRVFLGTKEGGVPCWFQGRDWPDCRRCDGPTRFVAQIDDHLEGVLDGTATLIGFGDVGYGYVFVCAAECCAEGGAFLWQGG